MFYKNRTPRCATNVSFSVVFGSVLGPALFSAECGQACFVKTDRGLFALDRQGAPEQGWFLDKQGQQFVIGEGAITDQFAVGFGSFGDNFLRGESGIGQNRP